MSISVMMFCLANCILPASMFDEEMAPVRQPIGILAYGSLIDDPGEEIKASTVHIERKNIMTPFRVEFARKSKERQGAPTLVPVNEGGASVKATLIVLKIDEEEAMNRLWRRETNRVGQKDRLYRHPETPRSNSVIIDCRTVDMPPTVVRKVE